MKSRQSIQRFFLREGMREETRADVRDSSTPCLHHLKMSLRTEIKFGFVNRFVAALTRPSNATSHGFRDRPAHIYSFTSSRPASAARRHSSLHEFQHPSTANHAWPSSRCPFPSLPSRLSAFFILPFGRHCVASSLSLQARHARVAFAAKSS